MHNYFFILIITLFINFLNAQIDTIIVNNYEFEVRTDVLENEWGTKDTIQNLYRLESENEKRILMFYKFKDEGGDCNNQFWNRESMEIVGDSILFTTHYFQKTGIDPIPEWRKQIYIVKNDGKLVLTYDKIKYYNGSNWVENNIITK